jgi:VanZ family protein
MAESVIVRAMSFLKRWLPVVLWAALILSASNDSFSSDQTGGLLARLFGREVPPAVNIAIRKLGHLVAYGILGMLAFRAARRNAYALGIVLLVAMADEYSQGLTRSRTGSPWDVLLDMTGAAIALFIVFPAVRARLSSPRTSA